MNLKTIFYLRKCIVRNFVNGISVLKIVIGIVFLVSLFLFSNANNLDFNMILVNDRCVWERIDGFVTIYVIVHSCFCFKTLITKKRIKIKGVYEFLAAYAPKYLNKIYGYYLLDRSISVSLIAFMVLVIVYGIRLNLLFFLAQLFFVICFISLSDYISKMILFLKTNIVKKAGITIFNIAAVCLIFISNTGVKVLLFIVILVTDIIACNRLGFEFSMSYYENRKNNRELKSNYLSIYFMLKKIIKNNKIAFVISKETIQIYMEKIPLIHSSIYGSFIALLMFIMNLNKKVDYEIYVFSFFISVSYSLVGISVNTVARDYRGSWIYKLYGIKKKEILIGKFLSYWFYSLVMIIIYYLIYNLIPELAGNQLLFTLSLKTLICVLIILAPIAFLVGANIGSCFTPKLKYKSGNIDYSYNGAEIVVLFMTIYLVALPAYLFNFYEKRLYILLFILIYQLILIKLILLRVDKLLLKKGESYGTK